MKDVMIWLNKISLVTLCH